MSRPGVKRTARKKPKPKPADAVAVTTRSSPAKGAAVPRKPASAKTSAALGRVRAARGAAGSRALSPRALRALGILLLVGAVLALGLLVRQLSDAVADRGRPNVLTNDLVAAAASVAMLVLVAVVWRIARARRD